MYVCVRAIARPQDAPLAWHGVYVDAAAVLGDAGAGHDALAALAVGDEVAVRGVVAEVYGVTTIEAANVGLRRAGIAAPGAASAAAHAAALAPVRVGTRTLGSYSYVPSGGCNSAAEPYESLLVRVGAPRVTLDGVVDVYARAPIDDGSGEASLLDPSLYPGLTELTHTIAAWDGADDDDADDDHVFNNVNLGATVGVVKYVRHLLACFLAPRSSPPAGLFLSGVASSSIAAAWFSSPFVLIGGWHPLLSPLGERPTTYRFCFWFGACPLRSPPGKRLA